MDEHDRRNQLFSEICPVLQAIIIGQSFDCDFDFCGCDYWNTEKVAASYVFIVLDEPVMFIRKTENAVCGSKGSECKHEK